MPQSTPFLTSDREFIPWLQQQQISLAFTTYQTGWLALIGVNPESGQFSAFQRRFERAMGLYCSRDRLYLSSKYQLLQLDNVLAPGQLYQGYDKLYVPRIGYTTGDLDVHDVIVTEAGQPIFISTLLNCVATTSDRHSCKPLWKPPFISKMINEDRCHLNGLAIVEGKPRYVTACSRSDVVDGWRDKRRDGGIVIDMESDEIILSGLSMPHSPRFYRGKLWVLNSGAGEFGYIDLDTGKFESVTFCPGYARGLAFWENYAIVGLSKPRSGDGTFSGLLLDERLAQKDAEARCGLLIIDLNSGATVHWMRIEGTITELYDIGVLPEVKRPMALGFQTQEIEQLITLEPLESSTSEPTSDRPSRSSITPEANREKKTDFPSQKPIAFHPGDREVILRDIVPEPTPIAVEKKGDRGGIVSAENLLGQSASTQKTAMGGASFPTLNVLLFFQGSRSFYRPILFSQNEIFCSPDCETIIEGDRFRTMKTPVGQFDATEIIQQIPTSQKPDLVIVKADATQRVLPQNLQAIDCPKILFCADTHHLNNPITRLLDYAAAESFDFYLFSRDRHHAHYFQEAGFANLFWMPVVHIYPRPQSPRTSYKYPLSFVGQAGKFHPYRRYVLNWIRQHNFPLNQQQTSHEKAAEIYADSLINLNVSLNGDLNLRSFEVIASGGFLLTDKISPQAGLELLFADGKHLVTYANVEELGEKIRYFLNQPEAAREIARQGYEAFWRNHRPEQNVWRVMDYLDGKPLDAIYQIEAEKRSIYLTKPSDRRWPSEELHQRISIYQYLQEMHRVTPTLRGLFWRGVDAKIICDAVDLPRLQVHLLQDGNTPIDSLYDRCEVREQIQLISPTQLHCIRETWDVVVMTQAQLQAMGVEEFCERLNFRVLILSDIVENADCDRSLTQYGWVKICDRPLVYSAQPNPAAKPDMGQILNTAITYQKQQQYEAAISLYRQVLNLESDNAIALTNFGKSLQKLNRHSEAIPAFRRAIQLNPETGELQFYLSQSLKAIGDIQAAAKCLREAIRLQPDFWGAYNNLGTILQQQNNLVEAAQCYEKALEYNRNFAQAQANLASIWQVQGDLERAKIGLTRALELQPKYVPALLNLGSIYKQQGNRNKAISLYQQVLALSPCPEAYYNLGEIAEYEGNVDVALLFYRKVRELDAANYNIVGHINYLRLKLCDWEEYERCVCSFIESLEQYVRGETEYSPSPLAVSNFPVPLQLHRQFAQRYARQIAEKMAQSKQSLDFSYPNSASERLRIGYISPDFREYAVGKIVKDMFRDRDRTQFEVYAYSTLDYADEITERIRAGCDRFVDISGMKPEDAARQINGDRIHILIDLAGRTIGNAMEVLALQPAPIQAQFLGYPDTMGADFIQYAIADSWLITPEIAESYTEEIVYLPHAFFSSPMEICDRPMTRSQFGLPEEGFVFCCFNSHYKITPDLFDVWMRILQQVPNSVLWLTQGSETVMANLRREAHRRGVEAKRLIFAEKIPNSEYLARYRLADLFLDTFIYTAGSTAISALWAGCPVLTRAGNTNASRVGASICAAAKLNSLICNTSNYYEQRAIDVATNPQLLAYYRHHLTTNRHKLPLFNLAGFVGNLEAAFRQLWENYLASK